MSSIDHSVPYVSNTVLGQPKSQQALLGAKHLANPFTLFGCYRKL